MGIRVWTKGQTMDYFMCPKWSWLLSDKGCLNNEKILDLVNHGPQAMAILCAANICEIDQ